MRGLLVTLLSLSCPASLALADTGPAAAETLDPWALVGDAHLQTLEELPEATRAALLDCALGENEQAQSCVRVTTVLAGNRPELARHLRLFLRRATSSAAIVESAAALSELPDLDQNDLLLYALLTGRGGPDATPHLVRAYLRTDPPWVRFFLRMLAEEAATPLGRALAAEAALTFARSRELIHKLIAPLTLAEAGPGTSAVALRLAALGRTLTTRCEERGPHHGVTATCIDTVRAAFDPARLRFGHRPGAIPTRAEVRRQALELRELPALEFHHALSLSRRFAPRRPATTAEHATPGDDRGTPSRRPPPPLPGHHTPVPAGTFGANEFPPDFWGFDPPLPQPDWYPRHIHLTIDDGPRPEVLGPTLDVLERFGVKATFFFVGSALTRQRLEDKERLRALLERVVQGGHAIGYHSMNHEVIPEVHESEREPDQLADSVTLFRHLVARFLGRPVEVRFGRFPGGRGAFDEHMPRLYREAGLLQHVFWNFGPGFWVQNTPAHEVAALACPLANSPEAIVVLLHEFPLLPLHLEVFFNAHKRCIRAPGPPTPTRAHFRKDHVFTPTLCSAPHPDLERLCTQPRARRDRAPLPLGE